MAIKLLRQTGIEVPNIHISTNQVQMALQATKQVKRAMERSQFDQVLLVYK